MYTTASTTSLAHISWCVNCANRLVSTPAAKANFVSGKKNYEKEEEEKKKGSNDEETLSALADMQR